MPGVVSSSNFGELLDPGLRKIFFDTWDEIEEQYSKVYNMKSSTMATETDFQIAGVGLWEEKESMGSVSYETIDPSYSPSYTHTEYAKGIQVERKLVDDEMYGVINKLPTDLARKGRAKLETITAATLNNGFTSNGYDGVPLFSNSHPIPKGTVSDNLITDALSDTGLKAALLLMRQQVDPSNVKISLTARSLIIPADLEFTALALLNSTNIVGSGDNDQNVLKGRVSPIVLDYLTDANNWFLQATYHEMNFFWRIKPEFNKEKNFDTHIQKWQGYYRCSNGYSDYRGMIGANVT